MPEPVEHGPKTPLPGHAAVPARIHRRFLAGVAGALITVALTAGGAPPAAAQQSALYTVEGIPVDATAKSPTAARSQAIAQGRAQAYEIIIQRLVPKEDQQLVPPWSPEFGETLFRGFGVEDEKISDVRYIAKVTYHFNPQALRDHLSATGARFIDRPARPVAIVPLWLTDDDVFLWGDGNPWREAWEKYTPGQLLVPYKLPLGDLTDLAGVDAKQAEEGDRTALIAFADRYEAEAAVVVSARIKDGRFTATGRRYGLAEKGAVVASFTAPVEGETGEVMDKAIAEILRQIGTRWKDGAMASVGVEEPILVEVTYQTLAEWSGIVRRIEAVPLVRRSEVLSVTRGVRKMRLVVAGGLDALTTAFTDADLILSPIEPPLDDGTSFSISVAPGALDRKPRDGGGAGGTGGDTGGGAGATGADGGTGGGSSGSTSGEAGAAGSSGSAGAGSTGGEVLAGPRPVGGTVTPRKSGEPSVGTVKEVPLSGSPQPVTSNGGADGAEAGEGAGGTGEGDWGGTAGGGSNASE